MAGFHKGRIGHMGEGKTATTFTVEIEQEEDGRWIGEVLELPTGALEFGLCPFPPAPVPFVAGSDP